MLTADEMEGVLAHELSHVAHRDVTVMTIASTAGIVAGMLTRGAQYGALFGGGRRDNNNNTGGLPIWLVVLVVSLAVYAISFFLTRLLSRYRELCADLREYHYAQVSTRTNEVMKLLTIISTIFIPLSFLAGVYGMNFDPDVSPYNMPELKTRFGYPVTLAAIAGGTLKKGDALAVARIAGIMAAKKTSELIPLCHPIALTRVEVEISMDADAVLVLATAETTDRTGVEMEALTAASVASLTLYDMAKAMDRGMRVTSLELVEKSGGKSGDFRREPEPGA